MTDKLPKKPIYRDWVFLFVGGIITLIIGGGVFLLTIKKGTGVVASSESQSSEDREEPIPDDYVRRAIDGMYVSESDLPSHYYAVMIENSAEAWPLVGISKARLVFEAQVEGNIPRFMALFDNTQEVESIGPVRSARPYYLSWVTPYDAMYTHVGGSPEALATLSKGIQPSLNEFFWGKHFWRSNNRYAPHNVFTSSEKLEAGYIDREFEDVSLVGWRYSTEQPSKEDRPESHSISLSYSPSSLYDVDWKYLPEENAYQRYQSGDLQTDEGGSHVKAMNVVVVYTSVSVIDEVGRKSIKTIGEGDALFIKNGVAIEVTWKKESKAELLRFFDDEKEVFFNPGPTWVQVLPIGSDVVVE